MYGCGPLDAMRTAYDYLGEWTPPGETVPRAGVIRYYFICQNWTPVFGVDYASHFYDQPSHKIGHLVKPPGYQTTNGLSPVAPEVCGCCFEETPVMPYCGCAAIFCGVNVSVTTSPWGAFDITVEGTWDETLREYRNFEDVFPPDSGYFIEAISYDTPSDTWVIHWSTPTDFVEQPLAFHSVSPCRYLNNEGDSLPPAVVLGEVTFGPGP